MTIYNVLHRQVTQTVDPSDEPVGLSEMKEHLRVDHTDEDLLILAVTQAAREVIEKKLARNMVQRTLRADINSWAEQIHLPLPPVASISSIKYYDTESPSVLQTLAAAEYEFSGSAGRIYRAYGTTWPDIYPRHDAIQITYLSGNASTSADRLAGFTELMGQHGPTFTRAMMRSKSPIFLEMQAPPAPRILARTCRSRYAVP
jgi:uncharacterized phiE125 gp8 family phage protein